MNITRRNARPEDSKMLFELHEASMRPYIEEIWGWEASDQKQKFNERLVLSQIEVIEIDSNVVGMVEVVEHDDFIHLNNIRIFPKYQGQGIGTHITRDIIYLASSKRLPLKLQVFKVNKRAKELYAKLGFQVVGELEHHLQMKLKI